MKTDPSRPTSGVGHTSMWAIGRTIKRKDSAYSTTPTETSMKADGTKINATAKEPTGSQMPKTNSEGSTPAIGKMTPNKAEALCFTKLEIDMMECGWTTYHMVRDE